MKKKTLALIAAAVLTATMSFARPRKAAEITMSGYEGSSTLANFPVLVRISPERIDGFSYADCAEGGADISFVAADGTTLLAHEVDTWDTAGESSYGCVCRPSREPTRPSPSAGTTPPRRP